MCALVRWQTDDGSTPAILAAANGQLEAFDALLELGIEMGTVCDPPEAPYH